MKTLFTALVFSNFVFASALEFTGEVKTLNASNVDAKIYPTANVTSGADKFSLKLTGYGIRQKTIFKKNVYVAVSYLDDGVKLDPATPMDAIQSAKAKAMDLTFTMDLSGDSLKEAIVSCLDRNSVDMNTETMKNFFSKFSFDMKKGERLTLISVKLANGDEKVIVEHSSKTVEAQGKNLGTDLWRAWFGLVDSSLEPLKDSLVGKKKNLE